MRKVDTGVHLAGSKIALAACSHLLPPFLSIGKSGQRVQLSLTHAQLQDIKNLATPSPETVSDGQDGWVSTQEAVVAHLTLSLWKSLRSDVKTGGTACVSFLVDVRRGLGVDDKLAFGTGFQPGSMFLEDMCTLDLKECATKIHEDYKIMTKNVAKSWCTWHRAFEYRVRVKEFMRDLQNSKHSDLSITINNNSKRAMPDFGAAGGGVASNFMSNMGPTLLIATTHGMDVILEADMLNGVAKDKVDDFRERFFNIPAHS